LNGDECVSICTSEAFTPNTSSIFSEEPKFVLFYSI